MKIRTGFVSNSSSSSFCIYGIKLSYAEVEGMINEFPEEKIALTFRNSACSDSINSLVTKFCKKYKFDNIIDFECGEVYIGRDPGSIGDDETGKQFRESIGDKLKPYVGDRKSEWHEGEIAC